MPTEHEDELLLVNYLLGNLSEQEQVQVEDRAFGDAEYLRALEAAEADLIDAWVRGELSHSERRGFEHRFLTSPQRRSKVEFAKALAKVMAESKAGESAAAPRLSAWQSLLSLIRGWSPALQFAAGMAALICVAGASLLMVQNAGMRSRVEALEAQRRDMENRELGLRQQLSEEQRRVATLAAQIQKQQTPEGTGVPLIASLVLLPGLSRAGTRTEQLMLNPNVQIAHIGIQLEARDDYPQFRAELRTRAGQEVLVLSNLTKRRANAGYAVSFDVPASALASGEYELGLKGVGSDQSTQDVAYYYFSVKKN